MAVGAKSARYARIYALGDEKVLKIQNELARNQNSVPTVARMIQQEWGDFTDVNERTLIQQLNRFRLDMHKNELPRNVQLALAPSEMSLPAIKGQAVDVLKGMESLVNLQMRRLETAITREEKLGVPVSSTDKMVETAAALYKDLQKIRFELGTDQYLMPIAKQGIAIGINNTNNPPTDTKSQVMVAANTALQILSAAGIPESPKDLNPVPTGR